MDSRTVSKPPRAQSEVHMDGEEVVDLTEELKNAGGYNHNHDEELGMYWHGEPKPQRDQRPNRSARANPSPLRKLDRSLRKSAG